MPISTEPEGTTELLERAAGFELTERTITWVFIVSGFGYFPVGTEVHPSRPGNDVIKEFDERFRHHPFHELLDLPCPTKGRVHDQLVMYAHHLVGVGREHTIQLDHGPLNQVRRGTTGRRIHQC